MHRRRNSVSLPSAFVGGIPETPTSTSAPTAPKSDTQDEDIAPAFKLDNTPKYELERAKRLLKFCQRTHSSIVVHPHIIKATYTLFPLNEYANSDDIFNELAERISQPATSGGFGPHWSVIRANVDIPDPEREGKTQWKENWPVAKRIASAKYTKIPPGPATLATMIVGFSVAATTCIVAAVAALTYL